jgi:hypothetical protein
MVESLQATASNIDAYLPVLWIILGLIACEIISRLMNRAGQHSPEPVRGHREECPHCTVCRRGGRFGTPCSMV